MWLHSPTTFAPSTRSRATSGLALTATHTLRSAGSCSCGVLTGLSHAPLVDLLVGDEAGERGVDGDCGLGWPPNSRACIAVTLLWLLTQPGRSAAASCLSYHITNAFIMVTVAVKPCVYSFRLGCA